LTSDLSAYCSISAAQQKIVSQALLADEFQVVAVGFATQSRDLRESRLKRFSTMGLIVLLLGSCLAILSDLKMASAYNKGLGGTHYFILDQAREILGNDGYAAYKDFLGSECELGKTYLDKMKEGSDAADNQDPLPNEIFPDIGSGDHYMSPFDHVGLNILYLGQFKSVATLCQQEFDLAVSDWTEGNYGHAMYNLGWAAHALQDVCVPHHAAEQCWNGHEGYEDWVDSNKNDFAVDSGGIYSFASFPDREYYPAYNTGPPSNAFWHYDGVNLTAYDWVDFNTHKALEYYQCVNYATGEFDNHAEPCIETKHPLPDDLDTTWTIMMKQANGFRLHFNKINMSTGDYVRIYDKNDNLLATYSGVYGDFWAPSSLWFECGDTLKIRTTTNAAGASWGYDIHDIKSSDVGDDLQGATSVLLPQAQRTTAGFIKFFFDRVLAPVSIKSDGSVDPPAAPIYHDGNLYTLVSDFQQPIVIEKDNLVIEGAGHTLEAEYGVGDGFHLSARHNITIQNMIVRGFGDGVLVHNCSDIKITSNAFIENNVGARLCGDSRNTNVSVNEAVSNRVGIYVVSSSSNIISNNHVTNSFDGIDLRYSANNNSICGNTVEFCTRDGIGLCCSTQHNRICGNMIESNAEDGIELWDNADYNEIRENAILKNFNGILIAYSSNNTIWHNNLINNTYQISTNESLDVWDNGCEGNYWSNYNGTDLDADGVGDTELPWEGVDNCPLINPYWISADVNHDLVVDIFDVVTITASYESSPLDPLWNPHADIAEPYWLIDIFDVVACTSHYEETW